MKPEVKKIVYDTKESRGRLFGVLVRTGAAATLLLLGTAGEGSAGPLVGVHFTSNGVAPANWTLISTTASPVNNLIDETGAATAVSLAFGAPTGESFFSGTLNASTIPMHVPNLANLNGNTYDSTFGGQTFTATFSGLVANQVYEVFVFGVRFPSATAISQNITITGAGSPLSFSQNGPLNSLFINNQIGSSANTLESYADLITASNSGTITITATGASNTNGIAYSVSGLAIENPIPEPSAMVLAGLGGLGLVGWRRRLLAQRQQ